MNEPNLFDEAPSELSQDAFFCWILKWLNHPEHPMRKVGWDLLQRILEKIGASVDWQEFRCLQIKRPFQNADFVAVVELKGNPSLVLVFEDKVDALLTGADQLERNVQNVIANQWQWKPIEGVSGDRIHGVLLKTGYDFDFRCPSGYVKINRDDLARWTEVIATAELERNNILRDWVEHFRRARQQPKSAVDLAHQMDNGERQQPESTVEVARQMDNRNPDIGHNWSTQRQRPTNVVELAFQTANLDPKSGWWSDPENQYKLFKELFCVTEEQIVLHRHRDGGENIWFIRQREPLRREYFRRMTPRGSRSMFYNFKFPAGFWDGDRDNRPFDGTCFSYYYRLLFVAGIWGIALRFWKHDKSPEEIGNMHRLAEIFTRILTGYNIQTHPFRHYDNADEATILLIDPGTSPGIAGLYGAHNKFLGEADQGQLW